MISVGMNSVAGCASGSPIFLFYFFFLTQQELNRWLCKLHFHLCICIYTYTLHTHIYSVRLKNWSTAISVILSLDLVVSSLSWTWVTTDTWRPDSPKNSQLKLLIASDWLLSQQEHEPGKWQWILLHVIGQTAFSS